MKNMNRYDYEKRRELIWQKFASIYNARIRNLKAPDDLISNAVRKVLNQSGNTFFEMQQERGLISSDISEKERVDTIMVYQICMGAGYWLQIAERILDKRPLPVADTVADQQIVDGFSKWERKGIELYNAFSDYISEYGERSDILPEEIVSCMIWAILHIKAGDFSNIPVEIDDSKSERKNINDDFLRLMTWGYFLGGVEEKLYGKRQDDRINIDDFSASLRADFISTKKRVSDQDVGEKHYCETCKKKIQDEILVAVKKEFCSDVCYLHYWKEERPNFGGRWITDENLKELERLTGQAREDEYKRIVSFLLDNFDANYIMLMLRYGDNRKKSQR